MENDTWAPNTEHAFFSFHTHKDSSWPKSTVHASRHAKCFKAGKARVLVLNGPNICIWPQEDMFYLPSESSQSQPVISKAILQNLIAMLTSLLIKATSKIQVSGACVFFWYVCSTVLLRRSLAGGDMPKSSFLPAQIRIWKCSKKRTARKLLIWINSSHISFFTFSHLYPRHLASWSSLIFSEISILVLGGATA